MNNAAALTAVNLSKKYGDKEVLKIDGLSIKKGAITGIIGPSGAGKSTLLRLLNRLEEPSFGRILYFGQAVPKSRQEQMELQRRMTMVFQRPTLLDYSVYDNIAFGLRARGLPEADVKARVQRVLEKVGMISLRRQRAGTLSGGEAQRVAFARAVVLEPEILFADEPTANLDPVNVEQLEIMTADLNREFGTTIVIVTHNLFQARRLCGEAVFLFGGQLVEAGEAGRIFSSPENPQTKAFVEGKMIY